MSKYVSLDNLTRYDGKIKDYIGTATASFITKSVNDLTNYYLKSETYTKSEVNNLISAISTIDIVVVQTLPTEDISTSTIYLVPKSTAQTNNAYDEYVYVSDGASTPTYSWEKIGDTEIDLSNYVTDTDLTTALSYYTDTTTLNGLLSGKQDEIDSSHKLSADLVDDSNTTNKFFSGDYTDLTNKPTIPTNVSDLTNDAGYITGMTILAYGKSTWADFIAAYNANKVVYTRASSNANPATGAQTRLAFMAYVNNETTPTNVEFQYYRSVSSHSVSQQGDQVYVYKLESANGGKWTVTTRETMANIDASGGLTRSYSGNKLTIDGSGKQDVIDSSHKLSSDLVDDSTSTNKFVTSSDKTTWNGKQDALVSGTNIKTINNTSILGSGDISISGSEYPFINLGTVGSEYSDPIILDTLDPGYYFVNIPASKNRVYFKITETNAYTGNMQAYMGGAFSSSTNGFMFYLPKKIASDLTTYTDGDILVESEDIGIQTSNTQTTTEYYGRAGLRRQRLEYSSTENSRLKRSMGITYVNVGLDLLDCDQEITGTKTFTTLPESSVVPTTSDQLVNKAYVDGKSVQYSTMPTADSSSLGKIVQYTGATTSNFVNGQFYVCVSDGASTPTYSWAETPKNYTPYRQLALTSNSSSNPIIFEDLEPGHYMIYPSSGSYIYYKVFSTDSGSGSTTNIPLIIDIPKKIDPLVGKNNEVFMYQEWRTGSGSLTEWYKVFYYDSSSSSGYASTQKSRALGDLLTGSTQTISGTKTFSTTPKISSTATITNDYNLTSKKYVDDSVDTKQDIIQYYSMPTASLDYEGKIVQFVGTSNPIYINGYFYKCVSSGVDTFSWEPVMVQPGPIFTPTKLTDTTIGTSSNPYILDEMDPGYYFVATPSGTSTKYFKITSSVTSKISISSAVSGNGYGFYIYIPIAISYANLSNGDVVFYYDNVSITSSSGAVTGGFICYSYSSSSSTKMAIDYTKTYYRFYGNSVTNSAQTWSGVKTFSSLPLCSGTPTSNNQLVNKKYVDGVVGDIQTALATIIDGSSS